MPSLTTKRTLFCAVWYGCCSPTELWLSFVYSEICLIIFSKDSCSHSVTELVNQNMSQLECTGYHFFQFLVRHFLFCFVVFVFRCVKVARVPSPPQYCCFHHWSLLLSSPLLHPRHPNSRQQGKIEKCEEEHLSALLPWLHPPLMLH